MSSLPHPGNQSGLRVDFLKSFEDDVNLSLSAIKHSKRIQANQAITGSRGTTGNAVESNFDLFVTSMAMKFTEEAKIYASNPGFATRILGALRNTRSIIDLDYLLPVSVGCTQNKQVRVHFRRSQGSSSTDISVTRDDRKKHPPAFTHEIHYSIEFEQFKPLQDSHP